MVTQVDNSLLKGPVAAGGNTLEIQYNNAGGIAGDPFLSLDLTSGSGQNPTLILDGTSGSYRRPTLLLNYDASDNCSIEFQEEGVIRGAIRYYASFADTDELRISNDVGVTGPTTGTITFEADNRLQVRISENGLEQLFGGFRMTTTFSASLHADASNKGNLWLDDTDDLLKWRDENGTDFVLLPVQATTTELEDNTDAINTDAAKVLGYMVKNTTTGVHVFASGNGDSDTWDFYDATTAHTPV